LPEGKVGEDPGIPKTFRGNFTGRGVLSSGREVRAGLQT